jgi:hypothetical protein
MAVVTVTHADKSKSDKDRVYFGGRHNWQDAYYVSTKIPVPAVGSIIDATTVSKDFNGKTTWFLNAWKPASGVPHEAVQGTRVVAGSGGGGTLAIHVPVKGWDIPTGDLSRFVSNVIGSAIAAELIRVPPDMGPWIAEAYRVLEAVRSGKILDWSFTLADTMQESGDEPVDPQSGEPEFDDDIPF